MSSSLEQSPLPVDGPQQQASGSQTQDTSSPDASPADEAPTSEQEAPSAAPTRTSAAEPTGVRYACRRALSAGKRECDAIVQGAVREPADRGCNRTAPYCASDLQAAYGVTQAARSGGKGSMVGIVSAYGYPGAAGDLATYRRSMGLPNCSTASGCLRFVNQSGRPSPLPKPNADARDDWRAQDALDLDLVAAICPNCRIALVQASSNKSADLAAAVKAAIALGAVAVANSYSGKEERAGDPAYRHPGRAIVASAGSGSGARAPCSYADVVCVGGTSLSAASSGGGWSERGWGESASGCSGLVAKPRWQHTGRCKTRSEVDLSAVADPATGVAVYESAGGGWQQMGGTGAAAAIVAALFALGPSAARVNAPQWIWRHGATTAYHHVGLGKSGYDGPTGWGTPNGTGGF